MNCEICEKELDGNKTKFCSNKCKQKYHYNNSNTYFKQTVKYSSRKLKFINILGGKCNKCSYNKNIAALEFHHIKEGDKSFPMDSRNLANRSEKDLIQELKKCELLCANCHREYHNPDHFIDIFREFVRKNSLAPSTKILKVKECKFCSREFKPSTGQIFCSSECNEKNKNYPSKEVIISELILLKTKIKVSSKFGISTKIINRILKS